MSFKRNNKRELQWKCWKDDHFEALVECGVPFKAFENESHWNYYMSQNVEKYNFLTPEYCYNEDKYRDPSINSYKNLTKAKLTPRLLALSKDHKYYRSK